MARVPHTYPRKHCAHGQCIDHQPEWKDIGEIEYTQCKNFFGKGTFWFSRCCGKAMSRFNVTKTRRCDKCGRVEKLKLKVQPKCLCCGKESCVTNDDGLFY